MLQHQFYLRILLLVVVGCVFVKTMQKMAQNNAVEELGKTHKLLKAIGVLLIAIALFLTYGVFESLSHVNYPEKMRHIISPNAIVRPSSQQLIWGYPTSQQSMAVAVLHGVFLTFGLAVYCLLFKKSNTTVGKKILKFIVALFFCILLFSTTDFHYFDFFEFIPLILFLVLRWGIIKDWKFKRAKNMDKNGNDMSCSVVPPISTTPQPQAHRSRFHIWTKRVLVGGAIVVGAMGLTRIGFSIYGNNLSDEWKALDQSRETEANADISKADSIARLLMTEVAESAHKDYSDYYRASCGVDHNKMAFEILRNAALKGDANAQFTLGCIYAGAAYDSSGRGWYDKKHGLTILGYDTRDAGRAAYWWEKAAEQGHHIAQHNLANWYRDGIEIKKDLVKATLLMEMAAKGGYSDAQLRFGDMHRDGEVMIEFPDPKTGITRRGRVSDIETAKYWWKKAAEQGNEDAVQRLEQLY